jgi:DNA-binding PadR family transcriptional regulator
MEVAVISTLGYALLSLLAREPQTGYDLSQRLKGNVGFFWQARHSQIYPELAKLSVQGLVSFKEIAQEERPDKKVYTITQAGCKALKAWVTAPIATPATRDELVLKGYTIWLADAEAASDLFEAHAKLHEVQLERYHEIKAFLERKWQEDGGHVSSPWFGSVAAVRRGVGYEREYAEWCRWVLEQLQK